MVEPYGVLDYFWRESISFVHRCFSHPAIITQWRLICQYRLFDKTVEGGLGSFVILNEDGWLITAAHNFGAAVAFNNHKKEITDYNDKIQKINSNNQLSHKKKKAHHSNDRLPRPRRHGVLHLAGRN